MPVDLATLIEELTTLNAELVDAAQAGDHDRLRILATRAEALERRRNSLIHSLTPAADTTSSRYDAVPARDRVIQTLTIAGRPAATRLIADLSHAAFDATINTQMLASLRRDEQRSYRSAHQNDSRLTPRDIYVVPALAADRYTPVRATLALSNWPLPHRLITPSSPRVDLLHVVTAVADLVEHHRAADPDAADHLLRRLSLSVPGVTTTWRSTPTPAEIKAAANAELAAVAERDRDDRDEAADRARAQLDSEQLLFGAVPFGSANTRTRRRNAQ